MPNEMTTGRAMRAPHTGNRNDARREYLHERPRLLLAVLDLAGRYWRESRDSLPNG